ncbi:hypothetical protein [Pedobacter psychrodurus]|uniref:hypothetical protein n=1 Tax=Pedobacter psychrodurus TaxID=2530456 RepID=UPI00292E995C|nr:hypothetical protein [Pedobacter psychrodurus]
MMEKKSKTRIKPILIIDELPETFGSSSYRNNKKLQNKISEEEKILLTLIANVIVEIALREEL